jgi:hypothetical protein
MYFTAPRTCLEVQLGNKREENEKRESGTYLRICIASHSRIGAKLHRDKISPPVASSITI